MSLQSNLTERDIELLSAYLDSALTPAEQAEVEARLMTERELRRELEAMRQTVDLLGALPTLKAPRDFTLPHTTPKPALAVKALPRAQRRRHITLWIGAAAAVFVFIFGGALLLQSAINRNLSSSLNAFGVGNGQIAAAPTTAITPTVAPTSNASPSSMAESDLLASPTLNAPATNALIAPLSSQLTATTEVFMAMPEIAPSIPQTSMGGGGLGGGGNGPSDDFLDASGSEEGLFSPDELEAPTVMQADSAMAEEANEEALVTQEAFLFSARSADVDGGALKTLGQAIIAIINWLVTFLSIIS